MSAPTNQPDELLPCPFCKLSIATIVSAAALKCDACGSDTQFTAVCSSLSGGCGATGGYAGSKNRAAEKWNTRAPQPAPQKPDAVAAGHNPDKLTNAQVETHLGWRLLEEGEIGPWTIQNLHAIERWEGGREWRGCGWRGCEQCKYQYRTRLSKADLAKARGVEPSYSADGHPTTASEPAREAELCGYALKDAVRAWRKAWEMDKADYVEVITPFFTAALSAQSQEVAELREERDYWKSHAAESDSELCALQDALGHPPENGDALEKGIERLRTLIASEGELGDLREQLAAIRAKDHELNAADELIKAEREIKRLNAVETERDQLRADLAAERAKREGVCAE